MAYSTVSQLGYMFLGLGSGRGELASFAAMAAIFHLFTHAFFKALLFLASGSVMHSMGNVIDMRRFSGLRHVLKTTHWLFLCGAPALVTAGLAAFYTFRAYFLTFWGEEKIPHEAGHHAHESPPVMLLPMAVLALGALGAGLLVQSPLSHAFSDYLWMTPYIPRPEH